MDQPSRIISGVIALVALAALAAQCIVSYQLSGSVPRMIWVILGYFTVLTNILVLVSFAKMALTGRMLSAGWLGGLTLWIAIVGAVYHTLLANIWEPVGLALWADQGLHSATPLLTLLFWLVFAPKAPLPWKMALYWLAWPLIYVAYALIRGSFTKVYPYPFIDLNALSIGQFAMNAIGLCIAFFLAGIVLIGIARGIAR